MICYWREEPKKTPDLSRLDGVLEELKRTDTRLALHLQYYQTRSDKLTAECKLGIKHKPKYQLLSLLRRRKMLHRRMNVISNQREDLFKKCLDVEQMKLTNDHVAAIKKTLDVCKGLMTDLNIDDVEQVVEDLMEVNQTMNEVSDVIAEGTPLLGPGGAEVDDEDILKELQSLTLEIKAETTAGTMYLPAVPTGEIDPENRKESTNGSSGELVSRVDIES